MADWTLHEGDCLEIMATLPAESVDAVVTDPPYELGFMGQAWDRQGIAYRPELWSAVLRLLKPGGHLLAFGGTRTYHRMACAVEDAGFEIRDQLQWLYGSGFPKAKRLDGDWRGWATALKPAHEPIVLARKPLSEPTVSANVSRWGTGALNIDGCRIGTETVTTWGRSDARHGRSNSIGSSWTGVVDESPRRGRWPANILLDEEAAAMLDGQSGYGASGLRKPTGRHVYGHPGGQSSAAMRTSSTRDTTIRGYRDVGGASRFFYVAKASPSERGYGNTHPTVKPIKLMGYLVRLVAPPGGVVLDPFAGSGTTLIAAIMEGMGVIGIEREPEYCEIIRRRMAGVQPPLPLVAGT